MCPRDRATLWRSMHGHPHAPAASTIVRLDVTPLDMPLTEPFAIAGSAPEVAHNLLVRVVLADGTVGLGEAAPFAAVSGETQVSTRAAAESCRDLLLGQDVRALRRLSAQLEEACPDEPAARAGLEQALLDASLRQRGTPMWSYFGGHGTTLQTDLTIPAGDSGHAIAATRAALSRGFTTLKIKVGALSPAEDAERVTAIHRTASEASPNAPVRLYLDANGGYSAPAALDLLARLERSAVPIALFEQPVARTDRLGLLDVARRSRVPICADESARTAADVLWLAQCSAVRAINLKLMKSGLSQTLAMYHVARAAGLDLMIGGMVEGPIAMTVAAHLAAGLGGFSFVDLDTALFIASHPFAATGLQRHAHWDLGAAQAGHGIVLR